MTKYYIKAKEIGISTYSVEADSIEEAIDLLKTIAVQDAVDTEILKLEWMEVSDRYFTIVRKNDNTTI
uniref:Uncharacterized protein n=1 Tax=viral metagenome TaxID=1070528 RepID=A0A6H1ZEA6_9ZZZZ